LVSVVLLGVALAATARAQPQPPAAPTTPAAPSGVEADLAALDRITALLQDDARRAALVADLQRIRASLAEGGGTGKPASPAAAPENGLLGALATGIADVGEDLPDRALGAPLDQKLGRAARDVEWRIEAGLASGGLERFLLWVVPGWVLALAAAAATAATPFVRRGRAMRLEAGRTRPHGLALLRLALASGARELAPLAVGLAVLVAWPLLAGIDPAQTPLLLALGAPAAAAALAVQVASHGLMLLGPIRRWRNVGYAQRRLVPWIGGLAAATAVAVALRSGAVRAAIGWDAAELAALLTDVAIACLAIGFVLGHREMVRYLLMGRRLPPAEEQALVPLRRVLRRVAARWHVLAILFVLASVAARLLRLDEGNAVLNSMLALAVIVAGVTLALTLDGLLARLLQQLGRGRSGTLRRIGLRLAAALRLLARAVVPLLAVLVALDLWGFGLWSWPRSETGAAILGPLGAIASVCALGWLAWVVIDSLIAQALLPADPHGRWRSSSGRVRTLLPFLRNLALVTICVLTGIAVLANLGINVAPLLAGAGVVGLAIGFGSQQLVQDLITGLFIIVEETIAVGDVIDTGDRAGVVEALTIRTVRIRDADGALHSIPFSQIKALKNRSRDFGVYTVTVKVGYDADLEKVMAAMREIGDELRRDAAFAWLILGPFELWGVEEFTAEGVVVAGAIKTRPLQQWTVGREFNLRLKRRLDALGILIAIPRMTLLPPPPHGGARDAGPPTAPPAAAA
jgi:small conductance mechanosensitive channel